MKKTNAKKSSTSKDAKLPKIANNTQKSKSPAKGGKSNSKSKNNSKVNVLKSSANIKKEDPKVLKTEDPNEKRKKRIEQEKKEEARDKKVYDQVLKEYQEKSKSRTNTEVNVKNRLASPKSRTDDLNNIQLPKIKISEKKTQAILEEGGMLDAYKYLVIQLCKNGLPTGNLFEYSAYVIKNYEKKWKEKKSKMNKEKVEQYWKEKKQEVEKFEKEKKKPDPKQQKIKPTKEEEDKIKALNRSLEQREINKLIANLDKSRSSKNPPQSFDKFKKNKSEEQLPIISNKNKVSVNQKESKNAKKGNKSKSPMSAKSNKSAKNINKKSKSPASASKKSILKKK